MAVETSPYVTEEEYLVRERAAEYKSEYWNGRIVAMAGASPTHVTIASNALIAIGSRLRGGKCRAFNSDLRVNVAPTGLYTYPDLTVVCGKPEVLPSDAATVTNPTLILEVLSPSTENRDRGWKFGNYRTIVSFREYVLISQDRPCVEAFLREDEHTWRYTVAESLDGRVRLDSIGCDLALADVYDGVEFPPPEGEQAADGSR